MDIKLIKNGYETTLDTTTEYTLQSGDKIIIPEFISNIKPQFLDGKFIITLPNGELFVIDGLQSAFQNNINLLDNDINKNTNIYDLPEEYTFISFLDEDDLEDNIIDSIDNMFEILEAAAANALSQGITNYIPFVDEEREVLVDEIPQSENKPERAERKTITFENDNSTTQTDTTIENIETPVDKPVRSELPNQNETVTDTTTNTNDDVEFEIDIPQTTEVTIQKLKDISKTEVEIPTVSIDVEKTIDVTKTRTVTTQEEFTNYRTVTDNEIVEVEKTREVVDTERMESDGFTIVAGQWVKNDIETFVNTRDIIDTQAMSDTGYYEENGTWYNNVITTQNDNTDYNLNQTGDTATYNVTTSSDIYVNIKSFKTDKDSGEIRLTLDDGTVKTYSVDDFYTGNNGTDTFTIPNSDNVVKLEIEHDVEGKSQEFKVEGISTSVIVPTVVEPIMTTETYYTTETRDITVPADEIYMTTETYIELENVEVQREEEFIDTRDIETVEEYIDTETIVETVEIPDPDFDTSDLVEEDGKFYQVEETTLLNIISDESVTIDINQFITNETDSVIVTDNVHLDLDELILPEDKTLEILVQDDGNGEVEELFVNNDNVTISYEEFTNDSYTAEMQLIEEISIDTDI